MEDVCGNVMEEAAEALK
jgi:hypothetical protein